MVRQVAYLALIAAVVVSAGVARAQTGADTPQYYAVEVVIFHTLGNARGDDWQPHAKPPAPTRTTGLHRAGPRAYRRLGSTELALTGVRNRLAQSQGYEVLEHFGWIQPRVSGGDAKTILLPINWRPGAGADPFSGLPRETRLYGTLRLSPGRLRLTADLRFAPGGAQAKPPTAAATGLLGSSGQQEPAATPGTESVTYPFTVDQRLPAGELVYLDGPVIALIAQVRPVRGGAGSE